ncbi:MAG: hypothetical protein AAF843_14925 [Bacteroidota bacterium]
MPLSPTIEYHKTRDFAKKLNATIEFIKENFKPLFRALLFIAGPPVILGSILLSQIFDRFMSFTTLASTGIAPGFDDFGQFILPGLGSLIFLLIGGTALLAVIYDYMILYEKQGKEISVNDVWQLTKKSFWQVLGRMLLLSLLGIVAYVILVFAIALLVAASPGLAFIVGLPLGIGFIYLIIPLYLFFIIAAYERIDFGTALGRSFKLIKGKWWSTFGLIFVTGLIQGVIASVFMIPWYVIFMLKTLHTTEPNTFSEPSALMEIIGTVSFLLYSVIRYMLFCIPLIAVAFQYFNLAELKESKGLMSKIDAFGTTSKEEDEEEHY